MIARARHDRLARHDHARVRVVGQNVGDEGLDHFGLLQPLRLAGERRRLVAAEQRLVAASFPSPRSVGDSGAIC